MKMKRLMVALGLLVLVSALDAQTGSGVIDGSVIDDAGSPIPRASVALMTEAGRVIRSMDADERGLFLFDALPDGRYTLGASRLGYTARTFGQTSPNAGNVIIALATNGRYRARLRLPRLGIIAGTITDEHGQPLSADVRAQRFVMRNGQRALDDRVIHTTADQQGRYRFVDLETADYLISANGPEGELRRMSPELIQRAEQALQQRMSPPTDTDPARDGLVSYVPVYFPGVVSRTKATPVTLAPGDERANVNLQLQVVPTVRVQGTVTGADGKPSAGVTVKLVGQDDGNLWTTGQTTGAGLFNLAPVPLGAYSVMAGTTKMDLRVNDQASATIAVRAEAGGNITGRVFFNGTTPRPDCRSIGCKPMLHLRNQTATTPSIDVPGVMDEAGPVAFSSVPLGSYTIGIGVPLAGWSMASAIIDGKDAMDVPIDIGSGQNLSGLVVTFTDRDTELTGNTPVGGSSPMADLQSVVVFPTDPRLWLPGARRVRVTRPDTRGDYRIAGLPPGEYFVAVVTNFDPETELDATRLGALQTGASRTTMRGPEPR